MFMLLHISQGEKQYDGNLKNTCSLYILITSLSHTQTHNLFLTHIHINIQAYAEEK